jgi:LysR family transcriptional regulator, nitrogen assimilation regulatory protein
MNLHQLYVFKVVVETGSFSKTASEVRIAQSAISYHIKMLEAEIGEPLFFRSRAHVSLTEKGKVLWKHVEKIFVAVEEAKRELGVEIAPTELRFGSSVSTLTGQLPAFFKHLREVFPRLWFNLVVSPPPQIIELLRLGKLDLGIVSLPLEEGDIATISLFHEEEQMIVVGNTETVPAARREISCSELGGLPLILYSQCTTTRKILDSFFEDCGFSPTILLEVDREDTILSLVRGGLGATILPCSLLNSCERSPGLSFLKLQGAHLRREVGLAFMKYPHPSPLLETAIRLCREHFHN